MLAIPLAEAAAVAGVVQPRVVRHVPAAQLPRRVENRRPRYANGRVHRVMQWVTAAVYLERSGPHMTLHTGVAVAVRVTSFEAF